MKEMGKLSKEERPVFGENANKVREYIISSIDEKMKLYKAEALREKTGKRDDRCYFARAYTQKRGRTPTDFGGRWGSINFY